MSQLFKQKIKRSRDVSPVGRVLRSVKEMLAEQRAELGSVGQFIANESISEAQTQELESCVDNWTQSFRRIATDLSMEDFSTSQAEAAAAVMAASSNIDGFLHTKVVTEGVDSQGGSFVGLEGLEDGMKSRLPAFEAYDEKDNRNAVAYSVTYNMIAGRQNEFGEAFFPTVAVTNDNVGVQVSIRLIQVFNDFKREITGNLANYQKQNIVKAMIDNTILKNDLTKIVPVYDATNVDNAAKFVAGAAVGGVDVKSSPVIDGETVVTAPLRIGAKMDLLALSQTNTLIANGLMDATDSIDPTVELTALWAEVDSKAVRLNVAGMAGANFVYAPQDLDRLVRMNFSSNNVVVDQTTTDAAGAVIGTIGGYSLTDKIVFLRVSMVGEVDLERGNTQVHAIEFAVDRVWDKVAKAFVAIDAGLAAEFATAGIKGYALDAWRTNLNRRQRGQLLDANYYNQIWAVPLRSPISTLRPVNADAQNDNTDLAALVSATFVRTSNEAVRTLVQTAGMLKTYAASRVSRVNSSYDIAPSMFGVARFLIEPTFIEGSVDVASAINNTSSAKKAEDVQGVLVANIRDIAYRLYRDSGFQAVVESQAAGVEGNPTVIIGTDPMTARYLILDGETRLAGGNFEYRVVTSPDLQVENQIFIALGYPGRGDGQLNPLHFGNMLWSPELVLNLPISRGGQISKELTVQPRFRHIVNVPVLGQLKVANLPEASTLPSVYLTGQVTNLGNSYRTTTP